MIKITSNQLRLSTAYVIRRTRRVAVLCLFAAISMVSAPVVYAETCKELFLRLKQMQLANLTSVAADNTMTAKISLSISSTGSSSPTAKIVKGTPAGSIEVNLKSSDVRGASLRPTNNVYASATYELNALRTALQEADAACTKQQEVINMVATPQAAASSLVSTDLPANNADTKTVLNGSKKGDESRFLVFALVFCLIFTLLIVAWTFIRLSKNMSSQAGQLTEMLKAAALKDEVIDHVRSQLTRLLEVDTSRDAVFAISGKASNPQQILGLAKDSLNAGASQLPLLKDTDPVLSAAKASSSTGVFVELKHIPEELKRWVCGDFQAWLDGRSRLSIPSEHEHPKFYGNPMEIHFFNFRKSTVTDGEWDGAMVRVGQQYLYYAVLFGQARGGTAAEQEWIDYPSGFRSDMAYHDKDQWRVKEPALVTLDNNGQIKINKKSQLERK
jgi:hypothetical protein